MQGPGSYGNIFTIPQGATSGQRIVIDGTRGAIFEYDASNNLVGVWASKVGTDSYGTGYAQGFTIKDGSILAPTIEGADWIINDTGSFWYNGTPALGNLIASITSATQDSFGNPTKPGITTYNLSNGTYTQNLDGNVIVGSISAGTNQEAGFGYGPGRPIVSGPTGSIFAQNYVSAVFYQTYIDAVAPANGTSDGYIFMYANDAGGSIMPVQAGIYGTLNYLVNNGPTLPPTLETKHPLGSLGVTNLDITVANYYMLPDGRVMLNIKGHATGSVTAGTASWPNTIIYLPATETSLPIGAPSFGHVYITTSGTVYLSYPAMSSGQYISCQAAFTLD